LIDVGHKEKLPIPLKLGKAIQTVKEDYPSLFEVDDDYQSTP